MPVVIVGAGPAGMLLAHLLAAAGVEAVVLERRDRAYVEGRVRAGIVEDGTVALLAELGLDAGIRAEGTPHGGVGVVDDDGPIHIDLLAAVGRGVTAYGQQYIMRDLFDGAAARGLDLRWNCADVALHGLDGEAPSVTWRDDGGEHRLDCEYIAGCDGFHGVARASIPAAALTTHERVYPFGWLGVLADVPPASHEVVYAAPARGFALASMRSPTRSRYYVQVGLDERIEDWSDDRFWAELIPRLGELGAAVTTGPSIEKSIAPLRSFVTEPMRYGRLFLAGDAAHIVPPTGAKGMNLAASDARHLADALIARFQGGREDGLDGYSARALDRVWKASRFSWWLTGLTHKFPGRPAIDDKLIRAERAYLRRSHAAQTAMAENYVGLPLDRLV